MKIVMMTETGADVGLGHLARCSAIREALAELGAQAELLVSGDEGGWLQEPGAALARVQGADIALVDSYLAPASFYEEVARRAAVGVYLDDYLRLDYPRGVVVNGAVGAEDLPYPFKKGTTYLLGVGYFPLRREFWDAPRVPIRERVESVLLTFGGSDAAGMTPVALQEVVRRFPQARKRVVVGQWFKDVSAIEKAADSRTELIFAPAPDAMRELMLASDMAVASAGQTLYELAKIGLPTLALAEAENQSNNARGWEEAGFIVCAGRARDPGVQDAMASGLDRLASREERESRGARGREAMRGAGARRLAKVLLELAGVASGGKA